MSVFGRDAFQSLSDKAFQEILKKEDNLIVWNEIMTVKDLKMEDPKKFDPCQICNLSQGIERKKVDISDFAGRKDIIENFPPGDVFICGKAAFGKTYVMLELCSLYNGYYIPLDVVKERSVLGALVEKKKRIFVDDFHLASPDIQEYIEGFLWDAVIASREEPLMRRDFSIFSVGPLGKEDIQEYFSLHNVRISEEVLNHHRE